MGREKGMSSPRKLYEMIKRLGYPEEIAKAFGEIPREEFIEVEFKNAYSDSALLSYKGENFYSTSSQPSLMAEFMRDVGLRKGMKVLEIGGGTGYNAAVMSKIVGEEGLIVSIEYEKELANLAEKNLKKLSIENVLFVVGDGYYGYSSLAPYDVIFATVGIDEIPKYWIDQLSDGGKIIAPMNLKSISYYQPAILFKKSGDFLAGIYKSATNFIKASGMLGNLNERLLKSFQTCEYYLEKISMPSISMSVLEVLTASVGKIGTEYLFVDKDCSAVYKDSEWLMCKECLRLKKAVDSLEKANFPDLLSSEFAFNSKRTDFWVERIF